MSTLDFLFSRCDSLFRQQITFPAMVQLLVGVALYRNPDPFVSDEDKAEELLEAVCAAHRRGQLPK